MPRVSAAEVKVLIDTDRDPIPFIDIATLMVDEDLATLTPVMSDDRLLQIELYLAGHFLAITEERGGLAGSETGESKETYFVKSDQGLNLTRFGQQAILLDTTGTLAAIAKSGSAKKARFTVI